MDELYTQYLNDAIDRITNYYSDVQGSLLDSIRLPWSADSEVNNSATGIGDSFLLRRGMLSKGHITERCDEVLLSWLIHSRIMSDLRAGKVDFETIQRCCFIFNAQFWLNRISYEQIKLLAEYYNRI